MNERPTATTLLGLSATDVRELREHYAKIDARVKRERLTVAALWAVEHGGPAMFDSKGWPVDADDWPLRPRQGVLPETMGEYQAAVTRAKSRRTRRANEARRVEAEAFDITRIDLSDIRGQVGTPPAMPW